MSHLFVDTGDIRIGAFYKLPWIYKMGEKGWRIPRATLNRAIKEGQLLTIGSGKDRRVRGLDLVRYIKGQPPLKKEICQ